MRTPVVQRLQLRGPKSSAEWSNNSSRVVQRFQKSQLWTFHPFHGQMTQISWCG